LASPSGKKLERSALFPELTLHDMRHTFVSTKLTEGIDILTVSGLVGHADPAFIMSRYAYLLKRPRKMGLGVLQKLLNGS
jgi:integrase